MPENISPELIFAFLSNQLSAEESMHLHNLISSSEDNRRYFEQIKAIWEKTGELDPAPVDVDINMAWQKMSLKISGEEQKSITSPVKRFLTQKVLLRAAAVLIPLLSIISFFLLKPENPEILSSISKSQAIHDTLPDGSIVQLNKNSSVSYPEKFSGESREVSVNGEVFFKVTPDKEKPFIIHAGSTLIRVLGTSFNISSDRNNRETTVFVKSGIVQFSKAIINNNDTNSIILKAGEKGIYNKSTGRLYKIRTIDENELFWQTRSLEFKRTKMTEVKKILEKCYHVNITITDKEIEDLHFSASFKDQPVDTILEIVLETFSLRMNKNGTNYTINKDEE